MEWYNNKKFGGASFDMKYTTYQLDRMNEDDIPKSEMYDSNTKEETLNMIYNDICAKYVNINTFAKQNGLAQNYLSEIFSMKKKNPNRDYFLVMFVALRYDIEKIDDYLKRLGYPRLYSRYERDKIIRKGIQNGLSVDEIYEKIKNYNREHSDAPIDNLGIYGRGRNSIEN